MRHGHRRGRVPLVLATRVDVGVDAPVDHGHDLDPGRADRDELHVGAVGEMRDHGGGPGARDRDPERPHAGEDVAGRFGRDPVDRGAVVGEAPGREGHGTGGEAAPRFPERHVDREVGAPGPVGVHLGELARSVQRVDDPDASRAQACRVALGLLGQHGVVRAGLREGGGEPGLRGGIAGRPERPAVERHVPRPGPPRRSISIRRPRPPALRRGGRRLSGTGRRHEARRPRDRRSARRSPWPACRHPPPSPSSVTATPRPGPWAGGWRERRYHPRMSCTFQARLRVPATR